MKILYMRFLFSILLSMICFIILSFDCLPTNDCSLLHEGTFLYDGITENDIVVRIQGDKHIELHNSGQYEIESKLQWVNECEYNMTMTKITIPDFPFGVGDVMNVKVDSVNGNKIYYTSTVKGQSWPGVLRKIK